MARYIRGRFRDVSAIEVGRRTLREKRFGGLAWIRGEFDHAIFGNVMQTSAGMRFMARGMWG